MSATLFEQMWTRLGWPAVFAALMTAAPALAQQPGLSPPAPTTAECAALPDAQERPACDALRNADTRAAAIPLAGVWPAHAETMARYVDALVAAIVALLHAATERAALYDLVIGSPYPRFVTAGLLRRAEIYRRVAAEISGVSVPVPADMEHSLAALQAAQRTALMNMITQRVHEVALDPKSAQVVCLAANMELRAARIARAAQLTDSWGRAARDALRARTPERLIACPESSGTPPLAPGEFAALTAP